MYLKPFMNLNKSTVFFELRTMIENKKITLLSKKQYSLQEEIMKEDILQINYNLKCVEFLLHIFDNEKDSITLGEIREKLKSIFKTDDALLNQYFGSYRLFPLMLMREEFNEQKKPLEGDVEKVKIIRDAIAHNKFEISPKGYTFANNKSKLVLTFEEFNKFIYKVENEFYPNINA